MGCLFVKTKKRCTETFSLMKLFYNLHNLTYINHLFRLKYFMKIHSLAIQAHAFGIRNRQ